MFSITNNTPEIVNIKVGTICYAIDPFCSLTLENHNDIILKIMHTDFIKNSDNVKFFGNMLCKFAKSSILIVDSTFYIYNEQNESQIFINNKIYHEKSEDFGYLCFELYGENCDFKMIECEAINARDVLKAQKAICFSESLDIPFISFLIAFLRYKKRKRLCINRERLKIFIENTKGNTGDG